MTSRNHKLIPAVARLDVKPRRQPRNELLRQQRQIKAWRKAAEGPKR